MAEKLKSPSATEKVARLGRNFNALGALAIGGLAAVIPGPNAVLASWATLNAAQAAGFEAWRQHSKNKTKKQR